MGFEYVATTRGGDFPFPTIAERLQSAGICATESVSSDGARFRWLDRGAEGGWSVDAEIVATGPRLVLTIHSGSRPQRRRLVEAFAEIAAAVLGEPIVFEEA